jgi:hypothetical protein
MTELTATRTLVKSPPELWAECSDAASLARHLGQFGEIRITRLEPETAVAWEGEHASGTVRLEPSGWGTRVVLTAQPTEAAEETAESAPGEPAPPDEPAALDEPEPETETDTDTDTEPALTPPVRRPGPFARLMRWLKGPAESASVSEPASVSELVEPEPVEQPKPVEAVSAEPIQEEPAAVEPPAPEEAPAAAALEEALESLGQAHHRPFSRS